MYLNHMSWYCSQKVQCDFFFQKRQNPGNFSKLSKILYTWVIWASIWIRKFTFNVIREELKLFITPEIKSRFLRVCFAMFVLWYCEIKKIVNFKVLLQKPVRCQKYMFHLILSLTTLATFYWKRAQFGPYFDLFTPIFSDIKI